MAPVRDNGIAIHSGFLSETNFQIPCQLIRTEPLTNYYEMESRPFARGKYAQVRRCRHKETGLEYAAKVVRKRRRSSDVRHEIMHEIRVLLMARQTDKIVKLHEVFETPTEIILMLEMVEGGELQRVLDEEEGIPEKYVICLVRQILEAVKFLHNNNIAHLDIKPQNILLVQKYPAEQIKLCDFGISRLIESGSELREIVGTPDYVAPEILHYDPIGLATDMWSVGILTYVLLTGYSPFGGNTKQETFYNITNGQADFSSDMFEGISQNAIDFITRLLVKNPAQRMTYQECFKHEWLNSDANITPQVPLIITTPGVEDDSDKENEENEGNISCTHEGKAKEDLKTRVNVLSACEEKAAKSRSGSVTNGCGEIECSRKELLLSVDRCSRSRSLSLERKAVERDSSPSILFKSSSTAPRISHKKSSTDFESIKRTLIFCEKSSEERIAVVY